MYNLYGRSNLTLKINFYDGVYIKLKFVSFGGIFDNYFNFENPVILLIFILKSSLKWEISSKFQNRRVFCPQKAQKIAPKTPKKFVLGSLDNVFQPDSLKFRVFSDMIKNKDVKIITEPNALRKVLLNNVKSDLLRFSSIITLFTF